MLELSIKNLKSIKDSKEVEIKPLTVLIGKNSCGKSSFLRVFPLMKQSTERARNNPILWYGDYVDFGSFINSLSTGLDPASDCITFEFDVDIEWTPYRRDMFFSDYKEDKKIKVGLDISGSSIKKYSIIVDESLNIEIKKTKDYYSAFINNVILKDVAFVNDDSSRGLLNIIPKGFSDEFDMYSFDYIIFRIGGGTADRENDFGLNLLSDPASMSSFVKKSRSIITKKDYLLFNKKGSDIDDEYLIRVFSTYLLYLLVSKIDSRLQAIFSSVQYFQPIRARGDRFYRIQSAKINEIDSDGNNVPMVLYNLSDDQLKSFQEWCSQNLGFCYKINRFKDNQESISIMVVTDGAEEHNLTDVGFGYSQIFPIVLSLWIGEINASKKKKYEKLFVIEQPELHLHPAFQQKIMKAIIKLLNLAKKKNDDIKFLIETHSETIVNYIGRAYIENNIKADDINLIVCEKDNGETHFSKMLLNSDGYIENWPAGFFSNEE